MADVENNSTPGSDNRAEVMMAAAISFADAGEREMAVSFFSDAASLFRKKNDLRSAALAQAWVDAARPPDPKRSPQQAAFSPGD